MREAKLKLLVLALMCLVSYVQAQNKVDTVDYSSFKIDGSSFVLTKKAILLKYGRPISVYEPRYECGFLSEAEQGEKYYTLNYKNFKFTGNNKEGYVLEEIHFASGLNSKITFQNKELSDKTTIKQFEAIFGVKIPDSEVVLYSIQADDALIFTFHKGRLAKIVYWSPC